MTALGRPQPHIGAEPKTTESRHFCRSQGLNCGFRGWGGWGSNPRPADYESSPPAAFFSAADLVRSDLMR